MEQLLVQLLGNPRVRRLLKRVALVGGVCTAAAVACAGGCSAALFAVSGQSLRMYTAGGPGGIGSCTTAAAGGPTSGGWSAEQTGNAGVIVAVGKTMGIPPRGWVIAVATAMQESSLINVDHGDTAGPDSRGLFQQRDSWGPPAVRMDPAGAARLFYEHLTAVGGWESMPLAAAAQRVQLSAFPAEYAKWEAAAIHLTAQLADVTGAAVAVVCGPGALAGGYSLPLPRQWVHPPMREHHDYPAVDIAVPAGTPVYAVAAGVARPVDEPGGCGTGVAIVDTAGAEWTYCHGSHRLVDAGPVTAGTHILESGWSGGVDPPGPAGAHLHVQIRWHGHLACPQPVIDALAAGQHPPPLDTLSTTRPCVSPTEPAT